MGRKEDGIVEGLVTSRRDGNHCATHTQKSDETLPLSVALKTYGGPLRDISTYWIQWMILTTMLAVYVLIMFLLNVPGCGKGYLGPGGIADDGLYANCTGGAFGYIDRVYLGPLHLNEVMRRQ